MRPDAQGFYQTNWIQTRGELEPIAGQTHLLHKTHILLVVMVAVTGDVSTRAINDGAGYLDVKENGRGRYLRENIPNARPFSVLIPGTLDLQEKKKVI